MVELFLPPQPAVGAGGFLKPNTLEFLGLAELSVPEESAASWVPCQRLMGSKGVKDFNFFEVDSPHGELGAWSLKDL